jgi:putative copper resistance protein D
MVLPDVLQHRLFTLLVVAFGLFEWMVRAGRLRSTRCALVFPLLSAFGGGLLLTHSHAAFSLKEEFLIELTHIPLGVLALLVGSTRWLELRLPEPEDRLPGRLWAVGLLLIGVLLLVYRER